jgi:hypothetical protein
MAKTNGKFLGPKSQRIYKRKVPERMGLQSDLPTIQFTVVRNKMMNSSPKTKETYQQML